MSERELVALFMGMAATAAPFSFGNGYYYHAAWQALCFVIFLLYFLHARADQAHA